MNNEERELDLMVAELEQENRLLRARNDRFEAEQHLQALHDENVRLGLYAYEASMQSNDRMTVDPITGNVDIGTVAQPEQNLNCKSVQARLATAWGYVKSEQGEPVGTVGELFDEGIIWMRELDRNLLVYIASPKENT